MALGNKASKSIDFYSSLHEGKLQISDTEETPVTNSIDFTCTSWDMIRAGALDKVEIETEKVILKSSQKAELISKIDSIDH